MSEIMDALTQIEKEKGIDKEVLMETIEKAIIDAYKKDKDCEVNMQVEMDRKTGAFTAFVEREVVEEVETISLLTFIMHVKII